MVVVVVSCDGGWLGVQLVAPVESLARKLAEAFVASGALTAQPFDTVRSLRTRPAHTPCAHALRAVLEADAISCTPPCVPQCTNGRALLACRTTPCAAVPLR
eukprot:SAG25_NODE_569_length_6863_cov_19.082200_1_plen_102_part_00